MFDAPHTAPAFHSSIWKAHTEDIELRSNMPHSSIEDRFGLYRVRDSKYSRSPHTVDRSILMLQSW